MATEHKFELGRRGFLLSLGGLAAMRLVGCADAPKSIERRRLGLLEVSGIGLGVQNVSRTYQNTVPNRSEMINNIRTAFDRGVTFFDAAEAYGPHEVERILGEFLDLLAHFLGLGDKVIEEAAAISVSHAVLLLLVLGQTVCPSVPTLGLTRPCL